MVIKGEKAPAFSATTLTLPETQIDNTGRIIENTRRIFSRNRADVEKEISDAINPPMPQKQAQQQQATPAPQSNTQAKQWPLDAGAMAVNQVLTVRPEMPQTAQGQGSAPTQQSNATADPNKPKRKRTRRRKKPAGSAPPAVS